MKKKKMMMMIMMKKLMYHERLSMLYNVYAVLNCCKRKRSLTNALCLHAYMQERELNAKCITREMFPLDIGLTLDASIMPKL